MAGPEDLNEFEKRYELAAREFITGKATRFRALFSTQQDVTLANPFGPVLRGPDQIAQALERAASIYSNGEFSSFDYISQHWSAALSLVVLVENFEADVMGRAGRASVTLRVTMALRPEQGELRIVHWHGDPIAGTQAPESVAKQ